jgi:hypothetical protein
VLIGLFATEIVAHADSSLPAGSILRANGTAYLIAAANAPIIQPQSDYGDVYGSTGGTSAPAVPPSSPNPLYLHGSTPLVMEAGTYAYNTFWEPQDSGTWSTYNSDMSRFTTDINQTGYYGNLTQYDDNYIHIQNHSESDGNWQDTQHYPTSTVYNGDIQSEVKRAVTQNGWPIDSTVQYNIFLPTNSTGSAEVLCNGSSSSSPGQCTNNSSLCSFHDFVQVWNPTISEYVYVAYTAIPYGWGYNNDCKPPVSTCPNGSGCNVDTAIQWLSHETFETTSDPFYIGSDTAWQDANGAEIADKCQGVYTGNNGSYNHTLNGDHYIVQDEWNDNYTAGGAGGNCTPYGPTYP